MDRANKQTNFPVYLLSLVVLMLIVSALSLTIYDRYRYRPIMTVDVETIMQSKLNQLQNQNLDIDKDRMVQLSQNWAKSLADEVELLSTEYNAIVLVRPAVIHGSIDMTSHVMKKLNVEAN